MRNNNILCPFYEEHAGECFQGCWEHNDICYLGQDVEKLSCYCTFDSNFCWFFTRDPNLIIKQIDDAFKAEYKRTVWNRKKKRWEWQVYKGADELQKARLKGDLDLIFKTLNELDKGISFYK